MLKDLGPNNRILMIALFLWALGAGLWLDMRQLYLAELGASHAQVGTALALEFMARALPLIPAGYLIDRLGPHRLMIASWMVGVAGMFLCTLATSWPMLVLGLAVYNLSFFAGPAISAYVLVSLPDKSLAGISERALTVIFATAPAGAIISPWLGGIIADHYGFRANLWISLVLCSLSALVVMLTKHVEPEPASLTRDQRPVALLRNRAFVGLAVYYMLALFALNLGFALAPNFLQDVRGFSLAQIGLLFTIYASGNVAINLLSGRIGPRWNFAAVLVIFWLAIFAVWQVSSFAGAAVAFFVLGGIYSARVLARAGVAQVVQTRSRGIAFGIVDTLVALAFAGSSELAGRLFTTQPAWPLLAGLLILPVIVGLWFVVRSRYMTSVDIVTAPAGRGGE